MSHTYSSTAHHAAQLARRQADSACLALASGLDPLVDDDTSSYRRELALSALADTRRAAETAILEVVCSMRFDGASWAAIAALIGTTKQGAQQKYGAHADQYARQLIRSTITPR